MADDDAPTPPILDYGRAPSASAVALARFASDFEANLAAGKLESLGVHVDRRGASVTAIDAYTGAQGAILYVHPADAERAAEILRKTPARNHLLVHRDDPPAAVLAYSSPAAKPAEGQTLPVRDIDPQWPAEGAWMVMAVSAIARVDPPQFLDLATPTGENDAPVLVTRRRWPRRRYRYLTSRHGMTFTTESVTPITFPQGVRVIPARRIYLP